MLLTAVEILCSGSEKGHYFFVLKNRKNMKESHKIYPHKDIQISLKN